jgi:hypothetical protein
MIQWDPNKKRLDYSQITQPSPSDISRQYQLAVNQYKQMQNIVKTLEHQTQTMKRRMEDIQSQFTYWDQFMESTTRTASANVQKLTDTQGQQLQTQSKQLLERFLQETSDMVNQKTQSMSESLDDVAHNFYGSIERFITEKCESAKQKLDNALQEAYTAFQMPAEADKGFGFAKLNPRFPNAKPVSDSPIKSKYNPFATPNRDNTKAQDNRPQDIPMAQTQTTEAHSSDDERSRFGPSNADITVEDFRPLPFMQAHKLVQNVKIPYPGKELTYTWYHTLHSAVKQYGILLIPVEEFKKGKSLCPRRYYGTKIDPQRYKEMANALYQLLILTDTIPSEYTDIRNILHRQASNTDGYSSLYEIMECIHLLLNADAKLNAPLSIKCTDIHGYINLLDSFFLHNRLEGIHFMARRQVNIFLNGLDSSYSSAISQIKQQMRSTWRDDDNSPPLDLTITSIARTIEQIMQEDGEPTIVQALARPGNHHKSTRTRPTHNDSTTRTYVDVQCPYCKAYGHQGSQCDRTAIFIILSDAVSQLQEKVKSRIIGAYMKATLERRAKRVNKIKSTVRQLYSSGNIDEADALWDNCIQQDEGVEDADGDSSTSSKE